ncbi:GntR family transcriptional regulator [Pseudomonas putida]
MARHATHAHDKQPAPVAASPRSGKSLTEQAYAALRNQIITCQMPPGLEVSELELSERLEMSKTPVREALMRLCLEGLVESYPRRGYRIAPVTIKAINDLFHIRAVLEGDAAALAALNLKPGDFAALDTLADASYRLEENKSREDFVNANREFHLAISRASGNPRLHALVVSHLEESERFFHLGAQARDINSETNREHNDLLDVLRKGDPDQAREVMSQHIESTRKGLLHSLMAAEYPEISL